MLITWLWCKRRSRIAVAITVSPSTSPHSAKPFVRRQDDAAAFVAGRNQRKQGSRRFSVVGPDPKFIDDQDLGSEVDPHSSIQSVLALGPPEILEQLGRESPLYVKRMRSGNSCISIWRL
jgi:hypothetical protein